MNSGNRITLLHNGDAYFPALEEALDRAVDDIYLETYIFENDHTGRRIGEALRRAARRGVRTHLLIDGFGSNGLSKTMIDSLKEAGVMVLKFRPQISPWTLRRRRLRRLHRKIVVIDQSLAFVGGMNIMDDVDIARQVSPRFDYAVRVEGPVVKKISWSTRSLWLRVVRLRRLRYDWPREQKCRAPFLESVGHMKATFLVRDNFRHRRDIEKAYFQAINQAHSEIILANAYFLPGRNFRQALLRAARRGVRVVLLLQGKIEYRLAHYASRALFGTFLDAGIEIYEYHQSILHAKVAVIDDHWATVGSSNLDPFSLLLALEANIAVDDKGFATVLKDSLEQAIKAGARRVLEDTWRLQPFMLRLVCWLSFGLIRLMVGIAGQVPKRLK
jgi:cardiolipin synthase A/B